MTRRVKQGLWSALWLLLLLGVVGGLGWLAHEVRWEWDWTDGERNSLSAPSLSVIDQLETPLKVTAYASEDAVLRQKIDLLLSMYQRAGMRFELTMVDPSKHPEEVRELGITEDGELLIEYQGRTDSIAHLSESDLSNALLRLIRPTTRKILFVTAHGERDPKGKANHDYAALAREAQKKGIYLDSIDLIGDRRIPEDADALVLADPRLLLLPLEQSVILEYVRAGGSFLWLDNPDSPGGLKRFAAQLGLEVLPGTVLDAQAQLYGVDDPTNAVVSRYPQDNPITAGFDLLTVFPRARAYLPASDSVWQASAFLFSQDRSWNETSEIVNRVSFDAGSDERRGPLMIGAQLLREGGGDDDEDGAGHSQRVAVIGDADFLSNQFIGNAGNLDLGLRLLNWLAGDDQLLAIAARADRDTAVSVSNRARLIIGGGFLLLLPAGLALVGYWLRRRRRLGP